MQLDQRLNNKSSADKPTAHHETRQSNRSLCLISKDLRRDVKAVPRWLHDLHTMDFISMINLIVLCNGQVTVTVSVRSANLHYEICLNLFDDWLD